MSFDVRLVGLGQKLTILQVKVVEDIFAPITHELSTSLDPNEE